MSFTYEDYTIGWICALAVELKAAEALLDEKHDDLPAVDDNTYTLGQASGHNVVVVCLPHGAIGTNAAAHTATNLFRSFPNIQFAMLIGVAGGIPSADVRLGDVVVGTPVGQSGGIIQYDRGTNVQGQPQLIRKGFLRDPPLVVRNAINKMRGLKGDGVDVPDCERPAVDDLYEVDYEHQNDMIDCSACDRAYTIERIPREPKVHYGLIGSGNQVIRNAKFRDELHSRDGILCLEMEAAGLLGAFECVVIRGICGKSKLYNKHRQGVTITDYCDTHKNKHWQYYASVAAATYAKDLLRFIGRTENKTSINQLQKNLLNSLHTCPYQERKDMNPERIDGTCSWVTEHPLFQQWEHSSSGLLWVTASPGCGKSVLSKYLVDTYLPTLDEHASICYFFFKEDFSDQNTNEDAMCALLRQLYLQNPSLLSRKVLDKYQRANYNDPGTSQKTLNPPEKVFDRFEQGYNKVFRTILSSSSSSEMIVRRDQQENISSTQSFWSLWSLFLEACASIGTGSVVCVIDGMDECFKDDARDFIRAVCEAQQDSSTPRLKFIITSRPYAYISNSFWILGDQLSKVHVSGDEESRLSMISNDIDLFTERKLCELTARHSLTARDLEALQIALARSSQRTYLWVYLILSHIEDMLGVSSMEDLTQQLPKSLDAAYEKIFQKSTDTTGGKRILQALLVAYRPLTLNDFSILLTINEDHESESVLSAQIDSDNRLSKKIRSICGLFVVVVDSRVYLLHQTARRFLLDNKLANQDTSIWKASLKLREGHAMLAKGCIRFLELVHRDCSEEWHWDTSGGSTFRAYCYTYWAKHCQEADLGIHATVTVSAQEFCWKLRSGSIKCRCQTRYLELLNRNNPFECKWPLDLPARLGLSGVVELEILRSNADRHDISRALWLAVKANHTDTSRILLQHRAVIGDYLFYFRRPIWFIKRTWIVGLCLGTSTLLHQAMTCENVQLTKLLLSYGANVNARDHRKQTPLHLLTQRVMERRHDNKRSFGFQTMKVLLDHGADLNLRDDRGWTAAAMFAMSTLNTIRDRHTAETFLQGLLSQEKNIDKLWRCQLDLRTIRYNVFRPQWMTTLLGGSAVAQNVPCMNYLLEVGANPRVCDNRGNGLLHCAVLGRGLPTVQHVLALNLPLPEVNNQGRTALMLAVMEGTIAISKYLFQAGAHTTHVDKTGMSVLMHAVTGSKQGNPLIDLCLEAGLPLDVVDNYGMTALMHALECGRWWAAERLLDAGANPGISNSQRHLLRCTLKSKRLPPDKKLLISLQNSFKGKCHICSRINRPTLLRYWLQHPSSYKYTSIVTEIEDTCLLARELSKELVSSLSSVAAIVIWLCISSPFGIQILLLRLLLITIEILTLLLHRALDLALWFLTLICVIILYILRLLTHMHN